MTDLPLRLAVGAHEPDSGAGCAMNIESWIAGETPISDFPANVEPMLARAVQIVNDNLCGETDEDDDGVRYLCPECAFAVLELAARTRNTRLWDWTVDERQELCDEVNAVTGHMSPLADRKDILTWAHRCLDEFDQRVAARNDDKQLTEAAR